MIQTIEKEFYKLKSEYDHASLKEQDKINKEIESLLKRQKKILEPYDRVYLARHKNRPKADEIINGLIENPIYLAGDRFFGEDHCLIGGIGTFQGKPVTFLGTKKGQNLEENLKTNFGMPNPEGYRKAIRLMNQANKFKRPIITFIDTSGAYPGIGAEERGQGEAIARCIMNSFNLTVPIISIITGEGGSGGALALAVGNSVVMFENSIYSILSPEGFSSIVWKDPSRSKEASEIMKITAKDLMDLKVIDKIIEEDISFEKEYFKENINRLRTYLKEEVFKLSRTNGRRLQDERIKKFRGMGI